MRLQSLPLLLSARKFFEFMRRISYLLVLMAIFSSVIWSCNRRPGPEEITLKFLNAVQESNYAEAKKYATDDSKAMLDALSAFQKMLPESSQEKFKAGKIIIRNVETMDSLAVVTYASDKDTTSKTLKLKKEKGEWKVAFTKETILPELNKPLNDQEPELMRDTTGLQKENVR